MGKIAVIIPYFGKFKPSFKLFYESCRRNPEIDWFIFTDDKEPENPSQNVKWISFTLNQFNDLATQKLGEKVCLFYAYKLCDFKPMYGLIFEDYIGTYNYWAFGDVDVIYGDVLNYLNKIGYENYDKINFAGHFCLIKNEPSMNNLFKESVKETTDWTQAIKDKNIAFDERDFNKKVIALNKKLYSGIFAADIVFEKGMQCVDKKTATKVYGINGIEAPQNHRYQLFVSENGKIFRYYKSNCCIKRDEFCYIHFRKEFPILIKEINSPTYIISKQGFCDFDVSAMTCKKRFMELVDKYNHRNTFLMDKIGAIKFYTKKIFGLNKNKD